MLVWVIKRSVCGFRSVSEAENQKAETWLCTKNYLADDEMKFLSVYQNVQAPVQLSASEDWKRFEKEEYYPPRSNTTGGETSNLSTVTALQVNVILLKNIYWSYQKKHRLLQEL